MKLPVDRPGWSNDLRVVAQLVNAGLVVVEVDAATCERCGDMTWFLSAERREQRLCMPCLETELASWGGDDG